VRENESKRGKDDMDLPWSNKSNVAVFEGGKNFSLCFEF
jgi:hypothetical protein